MHLGACQPEAWEPQASTLQDTDQVQQLAPLQWEQVPDRVATAMIGVNKASKRLAALHACLQGTIRGDQNHGLTEFRGGGLHNSSGCYKLMAGRPSPGVLPGHTNTAGSLSPLKRSHTHPDQQVQRCLAAPQVELGCRSHVAPNCTDPSGCLKDDQDQARRSSSHVGRSYKCVHRV